MLDQLGDGGIAEAEGSVEGDTLHGGAGDGDLGTCSSGMVERSSVSSF